MCVLPALSGDSGAWLGGATTISAEIATLGRHPTRDRTERRDLSGLLLASGLGELVCLRTLLRCMGAHRLSEADASEAPRIGLKTARRTPQAGKPW